MLVALLCGLHGAFLCDKTSCIMKCVRKNQLPIITSEDH